jgi:hypothetical protein
LLLLRNVVAVALYGVLVLRSRYHVFGGDR